MRVLVVGFPLPNPQFDNYNVLASPSWFDYDAVVVEPESISTIIEDVLNRREEYLTRADEPVLNRPTNPLAVGLGDMIKRRRAEAAALLANGGTIIVFARPEVVHEGVAGFPGCDRYAWLPAPAGVSYDSPFLLRADGNEIEIVDHGHPLAGFVETYRRWIAYRVRFDETQRGFSSYGEVFVRSRGGAAIGIDLKVGDGRVVFLPAFSSIAYGDQRFEMATALMEAVRRRTGERAESVGPSWAASFALPGSQELEERERTAAQEVELAQARLDEVRSERDGLTKYRALLWQDGRHGLETIVRDAFHTLGFELEGDRDRPGWIADGAIRAFFEVEAATDGVDERVFHRLQKRIEQDLIATREPKRGLLVVNGRRLTSPPERTDQFTETLKIAAETYRYGLLTTTVLFDLVTSVLASPADYVLRSVIRSRILNGVGEILGEPTPSPEPPSAEVIADTAPVDATAEGAELPEDDADGAPQPLEEGSAGESDLPDART
jgi:hypothetical protein